MPLVKATIEILDPDAIDPNRGLDRFLTVQFNPTTLRLQLSNNVDIKKAFGKRPAAQYDGTSSAVLSFDLIFDTADKGSTESPVDVRDLVNPLRQFLLPAKGAKSIPPRVQFVYGTFRLVGIITSLNVEYDLFASSGVPLRAKCAVSIKEQLPEFEAGQIGPGSNTGAAATDDSGLLGPGAGGGAPAPDRTGTALEGESAPGFAARMGLDPSAWTGLDLGGLDAFSLTAGASIDFSASVSVELGRSAGVTAGRSTASPVLTGDAPDPKAVTAAGGLQGAIDHDAGVRAAAATSATRSGFAAQPMREPVGAQQVPISRPDPRATGYGFGVPLRDTLGPAPVAAARSVGGSVPTSDDPTVPRWQALPPEPGTAGGGCRCGCGRCA